MTALPCNSSPAPTDDAIGVADDEIDALLGEVGARALALLTTGAGTRCSSSGRRAGKTGYWNTYWEGDDAFYGHVLGFKGLERPAVVLAVNGFRDPDRAKEMLYVGLSRARDLLVVCGDPSLVRTHSNDAVMGQLGV